MVGAPQRDGGQPLGARPLDRQRDPAPRDDLAEAAVALEHGDGRRVDDEVQLGTRVQGAALEIGDVLRDADDAVRVVAAQVGADQHGGDPRRVLRRHAVRDEDVLREPLERCRFDGRHGAYTTSICSARPVSAASVCPEAERGFIHLI